LASPNATAACTRHASTRAVQAQARNHTGEVLKIHGHGDSSVYDALAKLTEQQEGQLHPYLDGEGAFGKQYSTDSPSASRYTFSRLNEFANEFFGDIKKDTVHFVGEDKEHLQPLVLPVSFPNILVKQNEGIAVGMACYFPSFNLSEVCDATIAYIKDEKVDLIDILKCPDFSTGAEILYDANEVKKIIDTGKGKITVRSKYRFDKANNCIEVYEIPHNTTANAIVSQIVDLMKDSRYKEITDVRDETGFNKVTKREELKIAIDVKKNTDVEKIMAMLFKDTYLQKTISTNFNCLVNYKPQVLGVKDILKYWLEFRRETIVKATQFDVDDKKKQLHFLKGLEKVLLDIDKAIEIIRFTKKKDVITKLCEHFLIDEIQAQAVMKIELGNINEEYIIEKIKDIKTLEKTIHTLEGIISNKSKVNSIILKQLTEIKEKYGKPRRTTILYDVEDVVVVDTIPDYNVMFYETKEHYFKKIPLTSLRSSGEHRLKDGDKILQEMSGTNLSEILVFTNKGVCYKIRAYEIADSKTSMLGEYLPNLLSLDKDEEIIKTVVTSDFKGYLLFAYANGKISKIELNTYETKTKRTKLLNAYNTDSPLINIIQIADDIDVLCQSNINKVLVFNTSQINSKATKNSQGIQALKSKNGSTMTVCVPLDNVEGITNGVDYYRSSTGAIGCYIRKGDKITIK
jgi:DNA gyrase subunit A